MNTPNKQTGLFHHLKKELNLYSGISLGVFLFILFFQPFSLQQFDFNNNLIFIAGLGAIIFISILIIRFIFYLQIQKSNENNFEMVLPAYFSGFLILTISSLGFAFYIKFVGHINITFFIMLKIISICLAPPIILGIYNKITELKQQTIELVKDIKKIQNKLEKIEENDNHKTILFTSENSNETLDLRPNDVVMIKSADNYVEIIFTEQGNSKKKLLRNTLKKIEQQIKPYSIFIRCHRTCIININYAKNFFRKYNNYWLEIKDLNEQIPVSRQYLIQVKEGVLSKMGE